MNCVSSCLVTCIFCFSQLNSTSLSICFYLAFEEGDAAGDEGWDSDEKEGGAQEDEDWNDEDSK